MCLIFYKETESNVVIEQGYTGIERTYILLSNHFDISSMDLIYKTILGFYIQNINISYESH